jgi:hypothetical protein
MDSNPFARSSFTSLSKRTLTWLPYAAPTAPCHSKRRCKPSFGYGALLRQGWERESGQGDLRLLDSEPGDGLTEAFD